MTEVGNTTHKKIISILEDGNIHHKDEFKDICHYNGLRGRISELNKWGYVIRRVNNLGFRDWGGDYFRCITIPTHEKVNEVASINLKPNDEGKVSLINIGDVHYGNPCFSEYSEEKLDGYIDYIMNNDGVYTSLMGDMLESANPHSTFKLKISPQEQYEWIYDKFEPLAKAGKIISIIRGNHECLDEDTEVLTKRGWLKHTDLHDDDIVLTIGIDNNLEWNKIEKVHRYNYSGKLIHIRTRNHHDMMITPNHNLYYWTRSGLKNNKPLVSSECKDLISKEKRKYFPVSGTFNNKDLDGVTDDEIRLVGLIISDGGIELKHNYYKIYQRVSKSKYMDELLDRLKYKYTKRTRERNITHIMGKKIKKCSPQNEYTIQSIHKERLVELLPTKDIPKWVYNLSDRQFDILIEGLVFGDGSIHKSSDNSKMFYQSNKKLIDELQFLSITHGYNASYDEYKPGEYRLSLPKAKSLANDNLKKYSKEVDYNGIVWCISVPNHNFLVRRNGRCIFTGNSWLYQDKGFDIIKTMSKSLNVPYLGDSGYVGMKVGNQFYTSYLTHPRSGVTKKSSKVKMLEDIGTIHTVDIIFCAHIHSIIVEENITRVPNFVTGEVVNKKQLLVSTGSFLEYGDYAEQARYRPEVIGAPKIKLYADKWDIHGSK